MVVIRIKNNNDDIIPQYISNENIKISTKIKLCNVLSDNADNADNTMEKKIEIVSLDKQNSQIKNNYLNDNRRFTSLSTRSFRCSTSPSSEVYSSRFRKTKYDGDYG